MNPWRAGACVAALVSTLQAANATGLEYTDVYKVPRVLAMGGADVAVGGHTGALFTNPAGLAGLSPGWHIQPLNVTVASSRRTEAFIRQLVDALDIEELDPQREALVETLRDHRGRNLHGEAVTVPTFAWRGSRLAVSAAWLGAAKFDGRTHQGFGQEGFLEADGRSLTGPVVGVAWQQQRLRIGLAVKSLRRNRVSRTYSVRELVELTQEDRSIADDREAGRTTGFDIGFQYLLAPYAAAQPQVAVVMQQVPGMDFGVAGRIEQTVTAGFSFRPQIGERSTNTRISVEYFDVLHRLPQDGSMLKRARAGVEWYPWRTARSSLAVRGGLYQGAPTAGVAYRWRIVRVGLTTYAEEQGAYVGQDSDRRYVFSFGVEV